MDDAQRLNAELIAQTARATAQAVQETAQAAANVLAHENSKALTEIAVLKAKMTATENQLTCFELTFNSKMDKWDEKFDSLDTKFVDIFKELRELAQGRPTWEVALALALLSSICAGLATFVLTHHFVG